MSPVMTTVLARGRPLPSPKKAFNRRAEICNLLNLGMPPIPPEPAGAGPPYGLLDIGRIVTIVTAFR